MNDKKPSISNKCCKPGTYKCQILMIMFEENKIIAVDRCLASELCYLWNNNVKTIGCCCGHGEENGYIQVECNCVEKMIELGYEEDPHAIPNNGCFIPKTNFSR